MPRSGDEATGTDRLVRALLNCLRRDQKGSISVEFALIAPVFFFLTFGVIEAGAYLAASTLLESAVREAARTGVTGYSPDGTPRQSHVLSTIQQHVSGLLDPSKVVLETKVFNSFGEMQSNPGGGTSGLGAGGSFVLYTARYNWDFLGGYGKTVFGVPSIDIAASLAVRNEPF